MEETIYINFENVTEAEAGKLALDLQQYLLQENEIEVDIIKESQDTQDFGATIAIILGSGSVIAIAKGLANWLIKKQSTTLKITKDGDVLLTNGNSEDVKAILKNKFK